MFVGNGQLFPAAAVFGWGADAIGKVPDKPLLGAGGHGTQQNWGGNGQQQQQRRKPPVLAQPF